MTPAPPTPRELRLCALNGLSVRELRRLEAVGYRIDPIWGNVSPPPVEREGRAA